MTRSNLAAPLPSSRVAEADAGPQMKGTAFKSTLRAIEQVHGAAGLASVKAALDPALREELERILAVSWYPVSLSAQLHEAVRVVLGAGSWQVSRKLGQEAAKIDFTGVYRVLLRSVQYDTVFSRLELSWRNYYSLGTFTWDHRKPGSSRAVVSGVRGFNLGMWEACAGRAESLLKLTGAAAADVELKETTDSAATFEALWF